MYNVLTLVVLIEGKTKQCMQNVKRLVPHDWISHDWKFVSVIVPYEDRHSNQSGTNANQWHSV